MKTILIAGILLLACMLSPCVYGQHSSIDLTTPMSPDPAIRTGKLDNGLTYYIRKNGKPEKRIEMRLVVNAGSILENNDQKGLAHFMEHMNFNGTRNFPKNDLIDFLQKTGVKFGADINAYTSFDETVYMLQLPTDDSSLVSTGYQVLVDWAHYALLDGKEIDKERGIIEEEWRMGLGAQDRMMKKFLPVIFKDSRYAERLPIGSIDVIRNFQHETLRNFYRDWYRPDLQAVIVVGDLDPDVAEAKIKSAFGGLANPAAPRTRENYDLPDNDEPLIAITTDKEATSNFLLVFYKHPVTPDKTLADFLDQTMAELYTGMLNNRLNEISLKPDAPFVFAQSDYGQFLARSKDAFMINAMPKENQIGKTLEIILAENERVKRFGFTATEFERQREELMTRYEKASREADKTESSVFCGQYVNHYLIGDAVPGAARMFKYLKNILPEITLEMVNGLAARWVTDRNLGLVVMAPEKEGVIVPGESEIMAIIGQSKNQTLSAYVDRFREEPLLDEALMAVPIGVTRENKELGFTEMTLANGVKVVLKPTEFKNDEILMTAYSPGGHSLVPDEDFMSVNYAGQVIGMSGIGNFDKVELEKKLKGKTIRLSPFITDIKEGLRGSTNPKDLETLMQMAYMYVRQPRMDTTAFQAFISQMENQLKFLKSSPVMSFYDTLFKSAYPGYKRMVIFPTPEDLANINHEKLFRYYTERFDDASDFIFIFTGNFSLDSVAIVDTVAMQSDTGLRFIPVSVKKAAPIIDLAQRYLGNLPSTGRNENWKNLSPVMAPGITRVTIRKGSDPQGMVGMVMSEPIDWDESTVLHFAMLKEIISIKLIEVIREQLSGVYSPQVMLNAEKYPTAEYNLIVMFGCSPKRAEKLSKTVLAEITKLKKKGPTEADLQKAREALLRNRETDLQKNDFWLGKIESIYFNGDDPSSILTFNDKVNTVGINDLKNTAARYFNTDHYVRVILMPEEKK